MQAWHYNKDGTLRAPSPLSTYQRRRIMRKNMRPQATPDEIVLAPMMPPFAGFPECAWPMRRTKPQPPAPPGDNVSDADPYKFMGYARECHALWLLARTLEENTPPDFPLPERGSKMRAKVRRIADETSTVDSETFEPNDIPEISDIEPFDPRD